MAEAQDEGGVAHHSRKARRRPEHHYRLAALLCPFNRYGMRTKTSALCFRVRFRQSMAQDPDIRLLTSPRIFLVGMAAFLALVGFVVLILYQQIAIAFSANPGLNGLILGVLAIGALFTFRQVIRLFREIHWVNSLTGAVTDGAPPAPTARADGGDAQCGRGRARLVDHHHARDPRFDRHAARRGPRAQPLSGRALGLPRAARHVLGSVGDGPFDRRRHRQHEDRRRQRRPCSTISSKVLRADRRHERLVHLLAVRLGEFA